MKSVAQTVIEADRFYTIAAKTGSVIQAVENAKDGGDIRLGKYDHKPEQEWAFIRGGGRRLPYPQPCQWQAHGPDDDRHRQRAPGCTCGKMWAAPPRCGPWSTPRRAPSVSAPPGPAASALIPWAWALPMALSCRSGRRPRARTSCGPLKRSRTVQSAP